MPSALPLAARWQTDWNDAAAAEVEAVLEVESLDPEANAFRHRYTAGVTLPDPTLNEDSAALAEEIGTAPRELAAAYEALRTAFRARQASTIVRRIAAVAIASADLADPFQVTAIDRVEWPGARAAFSDLWEPEELAGFAPAIAAETPIAPVDPLAAGVALAAATAPIRATAEDATRRRDAATIAALRRARLDAALDLASRLARSAWRSVGSPSLDHAAAARGEARVWPNPVRAGTTLSFTLPRPGAATCVLYDVSGRAVRTLELASRFSAGPHEVAVDSRDLGRLEPGIYFARVSADGYEAVGRFVKLRE